MNQVVSRVGANKYHVMSYKTKVKNLAVQINPLGCVCSNGKDVDDIVCKDQNWSPAEDFESLLSSVAPNKP